MDQDPASPQPKLEYVGGMMIRAKDPKSLAQWYTDQFGLRTTMEYEGGYYGGWETPCGAFHFGICPYKKDSAVGPGNVTVTYRVDDFSAYLAKLEANGLEPVETIEDDEGRFAEFVDPEGNHIYIWGE